MRPRGVGWLLRTCHFFGLLAVLRSKLLGSVKALRHAPGHVHPWQYRQTYACRWTCAPLAMPPDMCMPLDMCTPGNPLRVALRLQEAHPHREARLGGGVSEGWAAAASEREGGKWQTRGEGRKLGSGAWIRRKGVPRERGGGQGGGETGRGSLGKDNVGAAEGSRGKGKGWG